MKILLLSDSYPPEVRSAANLMQELAEGLTQFGHDVSVCTLKPKYNLAISITSDRGFFSLTEENGVKVIRVQSLPIHNTKLIIRGIGELTLPLIFGIGSLLTDKPDAIAIYSPPLTLGLTAVFLKIFRKIPFILNVQDLFPQHIIDVGILKNRYIIKLFKAMEKLLYNQADKIVVHSEGNKMFLLDQRGVPKKKVGIIYNWVDTEKPSEANFLDFRKMWGLENKYILFFGGVMGYTQGLEIIIDVAERLISEPNIVFLLVGDGIAKPRLQQLVKEKGLSNIIFKPFITQMEYWSLLNEIDVGIITLSPNVKTPVVPSKILGYMAASKPYIASLNIESDVVTITQKSRAGIFVKAGNINDFTEAILKLYHNNNLSKEMGSKGKKFAESHFSREICLSQYDNLFSEVIR